MWFGDGTGWGGFCADALVAFLKAQDAPLRAEAERLTAAALASAGDDGASRGDA